MILNIKTAANLEMAIYLWRELSNNFHKAGVDTIILACTDLNIIFNVMQPLFQIIDSSLCLAEAVVKKWEELQ